MEKNEVLTYREKHVALLSAVDLGDNSSARELLESGASINHCLCGLRFWIWGGHSLLTILSVAVGFGQTHTARFLLDNGANINLPAPFNQTKSEPQGHALCNAPTALPPNIAVCNTSAVLEWMRP